ncbi:Eukaryotic translation initiation factor 4 gamma 3, partial [Dryobates pubescens]
LLNVGPRRSQPGQRREPRKIITVCVKEDVHLKKAENAWKPSLKRENQTEDPENVKTQELFRKVRSILNKLTPQMFNQLMKQVTDLTVDTEERLKGVIDLVFEKAIDEPSFSVAYANMCRCLVTLKVPMADKPGSTVNFRKLLLNRCQKEFEKDKADDDVFEKKQKELEAATTPEEKTRLHDELEEAKDKARRRSIGNIKFIGELFKLKMLTEAIMHDCVVKLLKNHDEESLECLCRLLTTIGKDLDFEKAKPRMDQYFNQMEKIVKERKTSSRIRFMLQDVIDLRLCNWVSRRADQGPKTIEQIHKEAKIEEQEEQRKVQQLMTKEKRRPGVQRVDEGGWNTVQGAKNSRVLDPTKFLKITKPTIDEKIQLVPKAQLGSWGKGSSGGAKASEMDSLRPSATSLNRFSALQPPGSAVSASPAAAELDSRRALTRQGEQGGDSAPQLCPGPSCSTASSSAAPSTRRTWSCWRGSRGGHRDDQRIGEPPLWGQAGRAGAVQPGEGSRETSEQPSTKPEAPQAPAQEKPSLSEEEVERKCKSIIDEFLHINDFKEATQCVEELSARSLLPVFVRVGVESTLERSQLTRDHLGQLLHQLVQAGKLSKQDFFKGFSETLELADDMAIDIPHIWLYLAELVTPMLKEGGISMRELIQEFSKPLLPVGRAGVLLAEILHLLCKQMSHKKVGALWRESGLSWRDLLPDGEDVQTFLLEQKLDFTESDSSSPSEALSEKELSAEELSKQLDKLIVEDKANDEQIFDWVEANLDESQMSSPTFLRALMTAVCKAAIIADSASFRVDTAVIKQRVPILLKYLDSDTEKELQALYALQASIVKLDQPPNLLRMFFDCLYDEEVISEDAFYKWESSKDPAEQNGKGVALKSVTAFFTWLREAEEESEDN